MTAPFDLLRTKLHKGTMLLEASAGTGKTYTIAGLVLRLLLEDIATELPQILVVTFTVAATEELKARLRHALVQGLAACEGATTSDPFYRALGERHGKDGAQKLRRALAVADEMSVTTIHGFCRRLLETAAFESAQPFHLEFVDDDLPWIAEAARDAVRIEVLARDVLTAAVATTGELLPESLVPQFRDWVRHQHTVLLPEPIDYEAAHRKLETALAAVRTMAHDGRLPTAAIDNIDWGSKQQRALPLELLGTRLQARLATGTDPALDWLVRLTTKRIPVRQLGPLGALPGLCDRIAAAHEVAVQALRAVLLRRMEQRLDGEKVRSASLSFQDLLTRVAAALRDPRLGKTLRAAIRERHRVALIDEFQDTDPLQYEVFADCFLDQRLLLVGDPKQSIYGFRGADVRSYVRARADAKSAHTLVENHRSHPDLVAAVAALFGTADPFADSDIGLPPVEAAIAPDLLAMHGDDVPCFQLRHLVSGQQGTKATLHNRDFAEERIIDDLAGECVRLLGGGVRLGTVAAPGRPLRASDIAILARTNAQAVAVQDELRRRGVHSAIGKAGDVFRCPEMTDMQRLLLALLDPNYLPWLRAAWTTPLFGLDVEQMLRTTVEDDDLAHRIETAEQWRRTWIRHGFLVMFEELLAHTDARRRLLLRPDGERKLTNYLQIAELLHHAEHARQLAPESLVQWLEHERRHAQEIDYELRELRLESDADAVQILTIHGSKGLQYEIVFVPFAWQSRDLGRGRTLVRAADGPGHELAYGEALDKERQGRAKKEQLAEDLRLLYVAVTRARRRCYLHTTVPRLPETSTLLHLLGGNDPDATVAQRLAAFPAALDALVARSNGTIGRTDLLVDPPPAAGLPPRTTAALAAARPLPHWQRPGFRIASFTAMLHNDSAAEVLREPTDSDRPDAVPTVSSAGMFAFARGANAGICLHAILERHDFASAEPDAAAVRAALSTHGLLDATAHTAPIDAEASVLDLLARLHRTKLLPLPFALGDLAPSARVPEWQFFLAAGEFAPRDLAGVFLTNGGPALASYAERLQHLPAVPQQGFLRGFLDLVAEHDGRYYVFDWKSNWLGDTADCYRPDRLAADMQQNHYVLQYQLYLLALHRHLRDRLADYDPDRHLGGACYVYLRGLDDHGNGVYCAPAQRPLLEALDRWLEGPGGRR